MKKQYFGDINDYRKYGLLRAIARVAGFRTLVAWMLTPDDGGTDGRFTGYLSAPQKWSGYDPLLYARLQALLRKRSERKVAHIGQTGLLEDTEYFSKPVPDKAADRDAWFAGLLHAARRRNFVFLDPDNGLEIKSRPYGRKGSSKYLFWREVRALWDAGKSLLIYQHFIREQRDDFLQRRLEALNQVAEHAAVAAFSTPHVAFLLALQPQHHALQGAIVESVRASWSGQIRRHGLIRPRQVAQAAAPAAFPVP